MIAVARARRQTSASLDVANGTGRADV